MKKLFIAFSFMFAFFQISVGQNKEITILFAYTTKAAMEVGGHKEIKKNVDNGLKLLNEGLTNSNIGYKAVAIPEFVHVKDLSIQENSDLISEFAKADGRYNKVHKFRKTKRADLLCLIFEGGSNKTSKGMLNGEVMVVTAKGAWDGSWIFPHEFGHVLGAIHGDDVGNGKNYNFTIDGTRYRTISNNGGVSIPYFSEDRTVNHVKDGKSHSIKIGDKDYQNAVTMRKNAPQKAALGDNLPDVSDAPNALDAELVNPETVPDPPGTKTPFALKTFNFSKNGKLTIVWDASEDYAKKHNSYETKIFDEKGNPDNWLTTQKGFINPGYPYDASYTTNKAERIKDGYKAELWYEVDGKEVMELRAVSVIGGEDKIIGAEAASTTTPTKPTPGRSTKPTTTRAKPTKTTPTTAPATDAGATSNNALAAGKSMKESERLYSLDKSHYLVMQSDGNCCIYTSNDKFVWCAMTTKGSGSYLAMQADGNLVVYDRNNNACWSSETHPYFDSKFSSNDWKPVRCVLENDGTLCLYSASNKKVWASKEGKLTSAGGNGSSSTFSLEYVSGAGQNYGGGGMPQPMVLKIKEKETGSYVTDMKAKGLSFDVSTNKEGQYDGAFNNLNNYCENGDKACFGGYYYVPSNSGQPPYTLRVTVTLKKDGKAVDSYVVEQNIRG